MATKTRTAPVVDRRAVSHQLREAIADVGRTAYALGMAAEVTGGRSSGSSTASGS